MSRVVRGIWPRSLKEELWAQKNEILTKIIHGVTKLYVYFGVSQLKTRTINWYAVRMKHFHWWKCIVHFMCELLVGKRNNFKLQVK